MKTHRPMKWAKPAMALAAFGVVSIIPLVNAPANAEAATRRSAALTRNQSVLTGTVLRDLGGDRFELRADNGRTYRVRVGRYDEPRSLDRGDRVRLTGRLRDGYQFVAQRIEFLRDTRATGSASSSRRVLSGVVTRDLDGDRFEMRADNGRTYQVRMDRSDEPRSLGRGDRVRITGQILSNSLIIAHDLDFLRDNR